ncbi:hypothetical protein [Flagellimonas sp.]|uniref:hypothetical protein n=1 Tax=Flagellimonas sp. TaxID=2058762 RepID=UPI003F4A4279
MDMPMQLHLAAQYLATAGISFLNKKEDDSHTNLAFSNANKGLETRPLDDSGTKLCLDYPNFSLRWASSNPETLTLHGKSHDEIVTWLKDITSSLDSSKSYDYKLHYDLPYSMGPDETFQYSNPEKVETLIQLRTLGNTVLSKVLVENNLSSDIRIWPHHFDTGAFSALGENSETAVGMGLTIPDSLVDDYYFYISGYLGHSGLDTSNFKSLTKGKWLNDGFKGAILPASYSTQEDAVTFFNEAIQAYKS